MKQKLSAFQILKQGTSFKKVQKSQQSQQDSLSSPNSQKLKISNEFYKFNQSDSESDLETKIERKLSINSERKGSIGDRKRSESVGQLEQEYKKALAQKKEKKMLLLKKYRIKITNGDQLAPITNFTKMIKNYNLNPELVKNLKQNSYQKPTPIQMIAIPAIFQRRNLVAIAPTGSGKTLAFALPLLSLLESHVVGGIRAIILSPTFELGDQIWREMSFLNQNQNKQQQQLRIKFISKINTELNAFKEQIQHIDILITTPLKFIKLINKGQISMDSVQYLVMDEADRYFELGFANYISQIFKMFREQNLVYLLFSATIQYEVEQFIENFTSEPIKIQIGGKNNVLKNVNQKLLYTGNEYGKILAIKNLINNGEFIPPVLIFVQSKERAEDLLKEIKQFESHIDCIHNHKTKSERETIINEFRLGNLWCLICTDVLGRGIDFKGIQLVINFDFPTSMINYIHRIGRTGRVNRNGRAITFFTDSDKLMLRSLGNVLKISGCDIPKWVLKLEKINKQDKKHREKYAVKRDTISSDIKKNIDKEYQQEIKIKDKIFFKKLKKSSEQEGKIIQYENSPDKKIKKRINKQKNQATKLIKKNKNQKNDCKSDAE